MTRILSFLVLPFLDAFQFQPHPLTFMNRNPSTTSASTTQSSLLSTTILRASTTTPSVVDPMLFPASTIYTIKSPAPLGIVLSEFDVSTPEGGVLTPLEVSDVSEGLNGGRLGVRASDVVISLNGLPLLAPGIGYDVIIEAITTEFEAGKEIEIGFFRGSANGGVEGFEGLVEAILGGDEELEVEQVRILCVCVCGTT